MIRKNAIQKAEKIRIPVRFSISYAQAAEIARRYESRYECGLIFFRLGYMQGQKAAKAEQRQKEENAKCTQTYQRS